jgi:hypothetical protein
MRELICEEIEARICYDRDGRIEGEVEARIADKVAIDYLMGQYATYFDEEVALVHYFGSPPFTVRITEAAPDWLRRETAHCTGRPSEIIEGSVRLIVRGRPIAKPLQQTAVAAPSLGDGQ